MILSHKPLRVGVQSKHKHFDKTLLFLIVRAIQATMTKMSHSFDPFQFYTRKILCPCYFSPVAFIPRKIIRHLTSDFDACEIDLDLQMSFLNAASWKMFESFIKTNVLTVQQWPGSRIYISLFCKWREKNYLDASQGIHNCSRRVHHNKPNSNRKKIWNRVDCQRSEKKSP